VVRFLVKITGYSRQQITRLIKQYRDTGKIERQQRTENWGRKLGLRKLGSSLEVLHLSVAIKNSLLQDLTP